MTNNKYIYVKKEKVYVSNEIYKEEMYQSGELSKKFR